MKYARHRQEEKKLGEQTDISCKLILKWANHTDLYRVPGIGPQFAELLEAAGVDTVKKLRHRKPEALAAKLEAVNAEKNSHAAFHRPKNSKR